MSSPAAEQRATVMGALLSYYRQARVRVGVGSVLSWSAWGDPFELQKSHDDAAKALDFDGDKIDRLDEDGDLGRAATAGTLSHARWMGIAQLAWDDIAAQMTILGDAMPSFSRVYGEVLVPTGTTVAAGVESASEAALPVLALVVAGLIAYAVIRVSG
jgi:hypothetical protein